MKPARDDPEPANERDDDAVARLRWRLALGPSAEAEAPAFSLDALRSFGARLDIEPSRIGEIDEVLLFAYEDRGPDLGASRPHVSAWLVAVPRCFGTSAIVHLQRDAVERLGLAELLFDPEVLRVLERNVELAAALVAARGLVPDKAREAVRAIVADVVADLRQKLEAGVRATLLGAARRRFRGPLRSASIVDWRRTILRNLRGWDATRRRLVPERLHFAGREHPRRAWDLVILLDQSGSMAESLVYGAVMAAIFASVDALRTRLLFFDSEVIDVTASIDDPVELVMSARLGGGTDLHHAIAYAADHVIERPEQTLVVLVSDLGEGGNADALRARLRRLLDDRVTVLCVLALSDESGQPAYDHATAASLAELGVPCLACAPRELADLVGRAIRTGDVGG